LDDVAITATGKSRIKSKTPPNSVARMIVNLLERHLAELEQKAMTVWGSGKK
jgi:hypothetical protein